MCRAGVPGSPQNLQVASQLQDLREKFTECGGELTEAQEEVETLRRRTPVSTGPVTHYTYTVPLVRTPGRPPSALCVPVPQCCWLISIPRPSLSLEVGAGVLWGSPANIRLSTQEALPGFQETLAEELRMSMRRIISDPVFFMERYAAGTPRPLPDPHSPSRSMEGVYF